MGMNPAGRLALACAALVCACTGSTGGDSPSGGNPSLAGVWDGVGTRWGKDPEQATVDIGPDHFFVTTGARALTAQRTATGLLVIWNDPTAWNGDSSFVLTAHGGPALSLGAIPLNVSGNWTADALNGNPLYGCSLSLHTTADGACKRLTDSDLGGPKVPEWLPNPENAKFAGSRVSAAPSIFGDLGGVWKLEQPGVGSCTVEFAGNRMDAACAGHGNTKGTLHVEVNGSTLSGYTSAGFEFSAQRR